MQRLILVLSIIFLLPLSQYGLENNQQSQYLENISIDLSGTDGRSGDVDCSGFTIEDWFNYDFGRFDINIEDDWIICKYRLIWLLKQYNFQYSERQR